MKEELKSEIIAALIGVAVVGIGLFAFFALGADSLAQQARKKLGIKVGT